MSNALVLDSLEIRRFRCFRELRIGRLGRVNLIVGKNNVGKSTLLEALRLFANPTSLSEVLTILATRNEIFPRELEGWKRDRSYPIPVESLFFGRRVTLGEEGAALIGPADLPEQALLVSVDKTERTFRSPDVRYIEVGKPARPDVPHFTIFLRETVLTFRIGASSQSFELEKPTGYALPPGAETEGLVFDPVRPVAPTPRTIPFYSIESNGLGSDEVNKLWDQVSLSPLEQDVIAALRLISPEADRVTLKAWRDGTNGDTLSRDAASRIAFVKIESLEKPIPLRALGDGVNRLFGIALALVHSKGGMLLVDEIENGIHYSVQSDLWRLVFEMASRLNVQVFATTHSYDCIKAFEAAALNSQEDGILVRLARKGDRTLVGEFDESELGIAVEGQIEVR
jgi:ABC-type transport system involved in cytochrome c biogenesis ATPase subunit